MPHPPESPPPSPENARLRAKNRAILAILLAFSAMIWIVSMIRMGSHAE